MLVKVLPSTLQGSINAPASKSYTQRACAAALITHGTTVIHEIGHSNDEKAAIGIIKKLGASVEMNDRVLTVVSNDHIYKYRDTRRSLVVDCGESGLSMRMFTPIASLFNFDITFTGKGSILTRPMEFFEKYLPKAGVEVTSNEGRLPITIRGPIDPRNITVSGELSSQFLTGMLFAYAKAAAKPLTIKVKNLQSKPYIDLTLSVLRHFGFEVVNNDYESFGVIPQQATPLNAIKYTVEGDWSNAAFLLVAGVVSGKISFKGMNTESLQGDKKILEALYHCGADVKISGKSISTSGENLKAFDFDATHCPDLFPPLVALAAYCKGTSTITGVSRLLHKESNRAIALRDEFGKMNVPVEINGDIMKIRGGNLIKGAKVKSHNDHRIAMACAVAALGAKGKTEIADAQAVSKSYPDFYKDLKKTGANISGF